MRTINASIKYPGKVCRVVFRHSGICGNDYGMFKR